MKEINFWSTLLRSVFPRKWRKNQLKHQLTNLSWMLTLRGDEGLLRCCWWANGDGTWSELRLRLWIFPDEWGNRPVGERRKVGVKNFAFSPPAPIQFDISFVTGIFHTQSLVGTYLV
jgi:hypothetical protein